MKEINGAVFALVAVLMLAFGGCNAAYQLGTQDSTVVTVTGKERVVKAEGDSVSSYYLVYTDDTTYRYSDAFFHFQWDTADEYGKLEAGQTYEIDYYGWRFGFLSMYPNIVDARVIQ